MPMNSGKDFKARAVDVAQPLMAGGPVGGNQGGDYVLQPVTVVHGTQDPCISDAVAFTLGRNSGQENVICFSSKDYGADAMTDLSPTLRAGGHADSHANAGVPPTIAYAIQERAVCENPDAGPDGIGVRSDDAAYTLDARSVPQAVAYSVALRGREGGATAELGDDLAGCLRASTGGGDKPHVLAPVTVIQTRGSNIDDHVTGTLGSNCDRASGSAPMVMSAAVCVTGSVTHTLKAEGFDASEDGTGRGQPIVPAIAFQERGRADGRSLEVNGDLSYALTAPSGGDRAQERNIVDGVTMAVRRLMPVECERLQGFPDGHTAVPVKKVKRDKMKPGVQYAEIDGEIWQLAADGPRYKQCGNSMATKVMRHIGGRIAAELARSEQPLIEIIPANDNRFDLLLWALVA